MQTFSSGDSKWDLLRKILLNQVEANRAVVGVFGETPAGTIDGANKVFTTANNFIAGSTQFFINGIRQRPGAANDYTETGVNQITLVNAPAGGAVLLVDYSKA